MDEDLGFDSGFDDMGSSDIDIDSGFDDASLDTDFSVDDIGTDDIVSDEFSEMDSSMDAGEAFDSFDDTGSADLDLEPVENVDSAETDVELELPEESFDLNVETDPSVDEGDLALDDFDENDSFDTDDTTSLTELDSEDFDSSDEAEDITDDTEDDFISETEEDGYFDSIPNEMEPYVMDEAQSETDADSAEAFTEVEEESPEDFEIGFETDALEETDSPNDTESNELPSAEIDNDTPDGDLTVEEADVPEDDKTPYEAMRDYMYEHNYSQMDYPEYSQDPEWQALNEQYTASLEETPATEETAVDTVDQIWDNTDTNEPQELHDGDVIDIQGEGTDNVSEPSDVFEVAADVAPEVSDTLEEGSDDASIDAVDADMPDDDKTPYETMRDYMYEHNYSQTDYPEYSQDPEWQALNEQYTASLDNTQDADGIDSEGMIDTDSEIEDYPAESTDDTIPAPEEESLDTDGVFYSETDDMNELQSDSIESSELFSESDNEMDNNEIDDRYNNDLSQSDEIDARDDEPAEWHEDEVIELHDDVNDTPDTLDADISDGTTDTGEESAELFDTEGIAPDNPDELSGMHDDGIDGTDPHIASELGDVTDSISDAEEFESYEIPGSLSDLDSQASDIPVESTNPPYVREYDNFETLQLIDNPEFYDTGQFYEQGINEYGFEGTCGPTSQANAINTLLGNNELTENKVLGIAVDNNLCDVSDDVVNSGGTTTENFMELYDKVNDSIGDKIDVELFDYDSALSVSEMAEKLDEGSVLNIAVDSATLWGENHHIPGMLSEDVYTDHWITVTGVERSQAGEIQGFEIIDSGGGENYVDAETYERMCFGEDGREMIDPTCIVVSKKHEK